MMVQCIMVQPLQMEEGVLTKVMNLILLKWLRNTVRLVPTFDINDYVVTPKFVKMPAIQLPKAYNFSYVSPGYVWEVLRTAVLIVIRCLLELTLKCDVNIGSVGFGNTFTTT